MTSHGPESAGINVGQGGQIDNLKIAGNVAGRDVYVGPQSGADGDQQARVDSILAELQSLKEAVAALQTSREDLRDDARDDLDKALKAGQGGDHARAVEKLDSARGYLERVGESLPAALTLAHTVASLIQ